MSLQWISLEGQIHTNFPRVLEYKIILFPFSPWRRMETKLHRAETGRFSLLLRGEKGPGEGRVVCLIWVVGVRLWGDCGLLLLRPYDVSLHSMLAPFLIFLPQRWSRLAERGEWRSWCFREDKKILFSGTPQNSYTWLCLLPSFFAVFTDCPLNSSWTCHPLSHLSTWSFKFKGSKAADSAPSLLTKKRRSQTFRCDVSSA